MIPTSGRIKQIEEEAKIMSAPDPRNQRPIPAPVFSVPEYIDRIEKSSDEILEQRENAEKYVCILWWGLDGLRMNEDGELEWVSKRKKDGSITSISCDLQKDYWAEMALLSKAHSIFQSIDSPDSNKMKEELERKMQILILQEQQTMINQTLCNMTTPVPTPGYISGWK